MKKLFFCILIFFLFQKVFALNSEKIAFFIPPDKWEIANPKLYPPYIEISFIKKSISTCRPTLNLAIQKTVLNLDEYTNEAKKTHTNEPQTICRILDKIKLPQGLVNICQINKTTNSVNFELLQMIFVKNNYAYVLTGACKKDEILKNYKIFMKVFRSFQLIDDLFSLVTHKQQKEELIQKFNKLSISLKTSNKKQIKKNIAYFEKFLDKKFTNLGKYFYILLIKKAYKNEGLLI